MTKQPNQYEISIGDLPIEFQGVARVIGLESAMKLIAEYSGDQIYVPRYDTVIRPFRNKAIRAEFDGSNYRGLACKYGLSTSHLRQIVKQKDIK